MFLSQKFVELIEKSADELSRKWLEDVQKRAETPSFRTYDPDNLYRRVHEVYSHLGKWISRETTKNDIREYFTGWGNRYKKAGFSISEVVEAFIIARRHLWLKILDSGFMDTVLDLHKAIEINNRVILFFDRAIYCVIKGYEEENDF